MASGAPIQVTREDRLAEVLVASSYKRLKVVAVGQPSKV